MMNFLRVSLALLSLFLVSSVRASEPKILSSIAPLSFIVQDLAGAELHAETLLAGAVSPHHYTLKLTDTKKLSQSDLFIWVGSGLEGFLTKAVSRHAANVLTLTDLKHFNVEHLGIHNHEDHSGHDHDSHVVSDAHIWLSYKNAKYIAEAVHKQLVQISPTKTAIFDARLADFFASIETEHNEAVNQFGDYKNSSFGVYHDGYSAFVDEFALNQTAFLTLAPDEQISLKKLISVKRELDGAACLLAEQSDIGRADALAKKIGLPAVPVDLLGSKIEATEDGTNFLRYMRSIRESFLSCLSGATGS